jgi:hypothetical protein
MCAVRRCALSRALEYGQLQDIENDGRVTGTLSGAFRTLADGTVHPLAPLNSSGWAMNAAGSVTGHMVSADLQHTSSFRYSDARGFEQFGTFGGNRTFGWGIQQRRNRGRLGEDDARLRGFAALPRDPDFRWSTSARCRMDSRVAADPRRRSTRRMTSSDGATRGTDGRRFSTPTPKA